jgi:hypothetical protein
MTGRKKMVIFFRFLENLNPALPSSHDWDFTMEQRYDRRWLVK